MNNSSIRGYLQQKAVAGVSRVFVKDFNPPRIILLCDIVTEVIRISVVLYRVLLRTLEYTRLCQCAGAVLFRRVVRNGDGVLKPEYQPGDSKSCADC